MRYLVRSSRSVRFHNNSCAAATRFIGAMTEATGIQLSFLPICLTQTVKSGDFSVTNIVTTFDIDISIILIASGNEDDIDPRTTLKFLMSATGWP